MHGEGREVRHGQAGGTAPSVSEDVLRELFASIDDGFCLIQILLDAQGAPEDYRFLEANAAFERHTGLREPVGHTARELVPDLEATWIERYGHVALTGEASRFESHAPAMGRWFNVFASRVGAPALRLVALVFRDVTERKQAEAERDRLLALEQAARAEAQAERQKLHDLFMQAPVGIAIHEGPRHTFVFANAAYRALVGGREVLGMTLLGAVPEITGQGFDTQLDRVLATGQPVVGDEQPATLMRGGRTETGWFTFIFSPRHNATGEVDGSMQCVFEVTQQVRARQQAEAFASQLRESEERLRRVVEASGTGTWELDTATGTLVTDARFRELFGLGPEEPLTLKRGLSIIHPEDRTRIEQGVVAALAGYEGGRYRDEYRTVQTAEGVQRWVEVRGQAQFGTAGRAVRIIGTGVDITARKEAEVARENLLAAISAQPALGVALFEGPDLVIRLANPLYRALAGHRDILGKPLLEALPEVREEGFLPVLTRVLQTGEPYIGREVPIRWDRHADGRVDLGYFHFVYQPVRGPDGRVQAVLTLGQEVTDIVRARHEAERIVALEQERASFEQQLIGIVSHDLRNPLQAILLGTTGLLRREELDERTTKSAARIRLAAERASRMVMDLLDFTQARLGGGIPLAPRPMDLHMLVRDTLEELRASYPERELRQETHGEVRGSWDADRLAQVVQNLVSNALKYGLEGAPVTVRTRGEQAHVEVQVHNAGAPIPPEALARLFQPMQRATALADSSGRSVGLGLFIVRHIVEAHGGAVRVESTAAEGTTFSVRLPRTPKR